MMVNDTDKKCLSLTIADIQEQTDFNRIDNVLDQVDESSLTFVTTEISAEMEIDTASPEPVRVCIC